MSNQAVSRLTAALTGRYGIERELGAGGMATVYLAEDLKHHRKVAIKVLKPELAAVLGADRFVQEIQTTAQLQHPHILPLFDSGQADGFLYYVMPYVEGETLREKLNRETQLGIDEAVRITTEVADALDYAHRHGVIHRDIKPENILLHDGRPMVADFGIALALSAAAGGRMTETGMSLGTPHSMSPEQATADKDITARSDIYSLGSVLYEMLTGNPPHVGSSAQQIIMKIIAEDVKPVTALRKSVSPNVAAALSEALEKLPADRFESAKAFAEALVNFAFRYGDASVEGAATGASRSRTRDPIFLGVAGIALIAVAGMLWAFATREGGEPALITYDVGLPDSAPLAITDLQGFAVAPDGGFLVYQAQEKSGSALWYRSLLDATTRRIDGTDDAERPAISPNGTRVAFIRVRNPPKWTVEVVPVAGGNATTLGNGTGGSTSVTWLADGRIQVLEGDGTDVRWFDPGGASTAEQRTPYCILPFSLPGSNRLLCGGGGDKWAHVIDPSDSTAPPQRFWTDTRDSTAVFGSQFQVVGGRYLVYLSLGGDLLAAPVNLGTRRVGRSVRLATGIDRSAYWGAGTYALSQSGTLVYAEGPNRAVGNLVLTDGRSFDTLEVGRAAFLLYCFSRDGRRLAAVVQGLEGQELLLERGDDVVIMHRATGTPYGKRVAEVHCDRNDAAAVRAALKGEAFDVVYDNVFDRQRGTTGEQVSAAAVAVATGLTRYVYLSSVAVYGEGGEYDEDAALVPTDYRNSYAAQKADCERMLFDLHRRQGLPVSTIRPAFVYGPHNDLDREAFFWDRLLAGRPIIVPEDGRRTMQWAYVADVVRGAGLAADRSTAVGHAYNVASYPPVTQTAFVRLLADVAGTRADLVPIPRERIRQAGGDLLAPPYYFGVFLDVLPITVRTERVRSELGLRLTPLETGLSETYRWYRRQRRPRPDFAWEDRLLASAQ